MELSFEPLSAAHFDMMARLWADPAVIRYTAVERPCSPRQARLRLQALLESQRRLAAPTLFAVCRGGEACGVVGGLPLGRARRRFAVFYQFFPACWGEGVGTASVRWLAGRIRAEYPHASLEAEVVRENTASARILEGAGFSLQSVRPGGFVRDGAAADLLCYRLAPRRGER